MATDDLECIYPLEELGTMQKAGYSFTIDGKPWELDKMRVLGQIRKPGKIKKGEACIEQLSLAGVVYG